jgi:hypothetical protein
MPGRHEQTMSGGWNYERFNMASANDIKTAKATYEGFVGLIKVAVPVILVLVAFVVWLIH